jgi:membrane protease YdiL (CAAX protease family)
MKERFLPFRWADALIIAFACVLPHVASLPMIIYPPLILLVTYLYLRYYKQTFADIGFRWKDLCWRAMIIGGTLGVAWASVLYFILGPLILKLTGLPPANLSDFDSIRHNQSQFIGLLLIAWLLVIPYEEIIFRGLILTLLRRFFGETRRGFWTAGFVQSLLFTVYHYQEGGSALISIFIGAILTLALYKLFKGNLWYLIFFHATYDTVMLTLFRYGYL